ncbi:GBS Bsp-like repeat-containing protein [Eubacterium callanderi]|uniref:GBS Bsp-like repeat-containing protein n=1 Tax=Eubacterium callanderi TaxID=53442 RepID=UPI003AB857C9
MQREKAKKNQIVVTMSILLLFLFSFIISSFPVYARSPVVVIQPGHSVGYDPGATNSSTGITEAAVNAAVAGKVATKLKQLGYTVYLTHPVAGCSVQSLLTNVEANSLSNVANAINKIKPDLAISVHHNSGGSSASGYEFYWSSYRDFDQEGVYEVSGLWAGDMAFRDSSPCWAAQESKAFASVLEKNFNGIGIDHRKTVERDDYVQAHVTCPSVLIEGGFISNPSESLLLASDAFQEKMSGRIVNSVSEYFGGATKDEKAPTADSITTPESPTTNAVFTVTANGVKDDLSGVSGVRAAVWCDWNDLKWYPANNIGSGQWSVTVDIKNHEDRVGTYYIDYYATDNAGNDGYIGGETIDIVAVPSISNGVSSVRINNNQFKVYAKGFLNYSNLLFPTWSNNDGMDDIKWYQGVRQTDGSYAILVDNSDHGYDVGKYYTDVYGTDSNGKRVYLGGTTQNVEKIDDENNGMNTTSIMGLSTVSSQQLVNLYNSTGNTFPSYYTENGRNVDLNRFAQLYIEEANAEGIRADVAFAQAMKETGWLKFGGQVSISQFNFAGLGATDDGAAGMSFAQKYGDNENGIRMGIRAQIQHLKAYASTEPLNNACVDERFNLVKRGCAPYVEWLGQKENPNGYGWATGANYGQGIIDIMNRIS